MSETVVQIEYDLPCARCGYNLRGLSRRGDCPECGHPIWRSLLGDDLAQADPGWLRSMRLGLLLALAATAMYFEQAIMLNWNLLRNSGRPEVIWWRAAVPTAAMFCGAAGAWLLTTHEPRQPRRTFWTDLPTLTRLAMLGHIGTQLIALTIWYSSAANSRAGMMTAIAMESIASRLIGTAYYVGLYLIVAKLTRRMNNPLLTFIIWVLLVDLIIADLGFAYVGACRLRDVYAGSWSVNYYLVEQFADCAWWVGTPIEMVMILAVFVCIGRAIRRGAQSPVPPSVAQAQS